MAFSPLQKIDNQRPVTTIGNWVEQYKEAFMEHQHDSSQLTLVLPDDCLVVAGPARLSMAGAGNQSNFGPIQPDSNTDMFWPVGFANSISISETRQVQPMKAIGSRRHIFAATNAPVQIQIGRLMMLGANALRSLYGNSQFGQDISDRNSKFAQGDDMKASWLMNLEEDLFRVPIGLGIIWNSPATLAGGMKKVAGASYCEVCVLQSYQTSQQAGQAMVMEQVSLMADRKIPWPGYETTAYDAVQQVGEASNMY